MCVRRDADAVKRLRREYDARRAAGFESHVDDRGRPGAGGGRRWRRAPSARAALPSTRFAPAWASRTRPPSAARRSSSGHRGATHPRGPQARRGHDRRGHRARAGGRHCHAPPRSDLRALRRHLHPQQSYAVVTEPLARGGQARARPTRGGAARRREPAALPALAEGRSRAFVGADQAPVPVRARQDPCPAVRSVDVRAVDDLSGDLRRDARMVLGPDS